MAHTSYRSSDGLNDVPVSLQTPLPVTASAGTASDGSALPANFDSLASNTSDRDGSGNLLSESRTDGTNTWTQTYTRDANGDITATSAWVKS
jgi:hypothetical protein